MTAIFLKNKQIYLYILFLVFLLAGCENDDFDLFNYVTVVHSNPNYGTIRIEVDGNVLGYIRRNVADPTIDCGTYGEDRVTFSVEQGKTYRLTAFHMESNTPFINTDYTFLEAPKECAFFVL